MLQIGGACSHDVYIQHFISIIEKTSDRKHFVLLPPRLLIYLSVSIFHCCRKFLSLSHHLLYLGNGWYALNEMLLRINLF